MIEKQRARSSKSENHFKLKEGKNHCLLKWYTSTESGNVFRKWLEHQSRLGLDKQTRQKNMAKVRGKDQLTKEASLLEKSFVDLLLSYLHSLTELSMTEPLSKFTIQPLIFSLGDVGANEVKSQTISITNYNPVSITLTAERHAIEGTEIRLGRKPDDIMNLFHNTATREREHSNEKMNNEDINDTMIRFLSTSQDAQTFFGKLRFRDDISLSSFASRDLRKLYHDTAIISMHRTEQGIICCKGCECNGITGVNNSRQLNIPNTNATTKHPPLFDNIGDSFSSKLYGEKNDDKRSEKYQVHTGPIILSFDGSIVHPIQNVNVN